MLHDTLEIIIICWFGNQTIIIIIILLLLLLLLVDGCELWNVEFFSGKNK